MPLDSQVSQFHKSTWTASQVAGVQGIEKDQQQGKNPPRAASKLEFAAEEFGGMGVDPDSAVNVQAEEFAGPAGEGVPGAAPRIPAGVGHQRVPSDPGSDQPSSFLELTATARVLQHSEEPKNARLEQRPASHGQHRGLRRTTNTTNTTNTERLSSREN